MGMDVNIVSSGQPLPVDDPAPSSRPTESDAARFQQLLNDDGGGGGGGGGDEAPRRAGIDDPGPDKDGNSKPTVGDQILQSMNKLTARSQETQDYLDHVMNGPTGVLQAVQLQHALTLKSLEVQAVSKVGGHFATMIEQLTNPR